MTDYLIDSPKLCLVVASDAEHRAAAQVLKEHGSLNRVLLIKCGIGAAGFAETFSARLDAGHFDTVMIAGLCGALSPQLLRGDVVVYDRCRTIESALDLDASLTRTLVNTLSCIQGTGLTVSRVITEAAEKRALCRDSTAIAVDMETFHVASVCRERGVPVVALRVVSDTADEDLPDFNKALTAKGEIIGWRVPPVLIARPRASLRFLSSLKPTMDAFKKALGDALDAFLTQRHRARRGTEI